MTTGREATHKHVFFSHGNSRRCACGAMEPGQRATARDARDHLIAVAQVEAENHREDRERGGCTCGFCAWSAEHVLVMSMRHALEGVGVVL